ncbi:MAG: class II aldolase/adducin family protein [Chloroflexi bacterium]|nr:class II aldolase/adducin family protein [Chloroflexota bacterium]
MEEADLKQKLLTLSRILYKEGFLDSFGHISVRVPGKDYYWITRGEPSGKGDFDVRDLVRVDFHGNKLEGQGQPPVEYIIHTVLHRSRQDAGCVVHVHPYHCILLTVAGIRFVPLTVQAATFGDSLPVYDVPGLIITPDEGATMLDIMGNAKAILLRGHGVVTAGATIEEAFYLTYHLEESCKFLADAHRLGPVIPLTRAEIQKRLDYVKSRPADKNPYAKVWAYHEFKTRN